MKKIYDLNDLFSEQLKELYNAEKQELAVLKKLAKKLETKDFENLNQRNIEKTELHIDRLEEIFMKLGHAKRATENKIMKEMADKCISITKVSENSEVLEAALILALQNIKHYEIANYGTLIAFADLLEKNEVSEHLKKSIMEEESIDKDLTELAEKTINKRAKELVAEPM